jgi:hypothetical protein
MFDQPCDQTENGSKSETHAQHTGIDKQLASIIVKVALGKLFHHSINLLCFSRQAEASQELTVNASQFQVANTSKPNQVDHQGVTTYRKA